MMSAAANSTDKRKRREKQWEDKRTEIFEATTALLLRYGNRATTMDEIASAASVSTASLYKYFPDGKDELYEMLLDHCLQLDEKSLEEAFDDTKTPLQELIDVGERYLAFALEWPGFFQLVAQPRVFGPLTTKQKKHIDIRVPRLVGKVANVIMRGQRHDLPAEQRFREDLDPHETAQMLHGAWNGILGLSVRDDKSKVKDNDLVRLAALAAEIVQNGMMSRRLDRARAEALEMAVNAFDTATSRDFRANLDAQLRKEFSITLEDLLNAPRPEAESVEPR